VPNWSLSVEVKTVAHKQKPCSQMRFPFVWEMTVGEATACVTNAALQHKANDDKKFCAGLVEWGQFRPPGPHVKITFPLQFSKDYSIPSIAPFPIKAVVHYPFILFG
jgi:hypothetical protein